MPFFVKSRRSGAATRAMWEQSLRVQFGSVTILDMTSHGPEPWIRFSPFFPHGDIPVPFSSGVSGQSVEGIWQALKVFEHQDVDPSRLLITSMRGLKRAVRVHGRVLGHREGMDGARLLPYVEARRTIYLPSYKWVLEHRLRQSLAELRRVGESGAVILLDYETNTDVENAAKPLSHAGLVAAYLNEDWPDTTTRCDQMHSPG